MVALVIWASGWGSLLLIAWRTEAVTSVLLRSPGYMIGDFLMLPLAGFLIARYYRTHGSPHLLENAARATLLAISIATLATITLTLFSLLISQHYHGVWSVPHTLFIWLIACILTGFFLRSTPRLWSNRTWSSYFPYVSVVLALVVHISLKLAFTVDGAAVSLR